MGGRGAATGRNGKGITKETRNILSASPSNILSGKTGTEKQESYASSLVEMNKNTLKKKINERKAAFVTYNQRMENAKGKSDKLKSMLEKSAKASLKSELKQANEQIRRYTQRLKKAKRQKTYGQVISVLS